MDQSTNNPESRQYLALCVKKAAEQLLEKVSEENTAQEWETLSVKYLELQTGVTGMAGACYARAAELRLEERMRNAG